MPDVLTQVREALVERTTRETEISVRLTLPGDRPPEPSEIDTPVPFLSHMLCALARHGALGLKVLARGDTEIDDHHTVEDTGLVLGSALDRALGSRAGIARFGHFSLCMDETLVDCALDLGGRPYLVFDLPVIAGRRVGNFDCDLVREFFQALVMHGAITLHVDRLHGINSHHIAEATFKAVARSLREAVEVDPRAQDVVPSTKGVL